MENQFALHNSEMVFLLPELFSWRRQVLTGLIKKLLSDKDNIFLFFYSLCQVWN